MTVKEVTALEGAALVENGAFLLDVRNADEWAAGRSLSSAWIPLGELEDRHTEIPAGRQIVCICKVGGRSMMAAEFLIAQGHEAVNLSGGMRAWAAGGLDVVATDGNAGTVI